MEEISNQTQAADSQPDMFLENLTEAPAAEEAPWPDEAPAGDGAAIQAQTPSVQAAPVQEADIQADLASFAAAFPAVFDQAKDTPGVIPQCVWDAMRDQGLSLTAAYARYVTAQARAAADNHNNAVRSTGSMRSAGNDAKNTDAFLSALEA